MIFNFLGSNYPRGFSWRFLLAGKSEPACEELGELLQKRYGGTTLLYYRGRAALREAVRLSAADYVLVNSFTCYVVEQAVKDAGSQPVFADISSRTFNFTLAEIKKARRTQPGIGAVIIQNTFGIGDEIRPIAKYCSREGLILIEDLAHCPDNSYSDGAAFGSVGDLVVLSFGDLKQIDVVAGGALIVRDKELASKAMKPRPIEGYRWFRFRERLQPLVTLLLRNSYRWRPLARVVHGLLNRSGLLIRSTDGSLFQNIGLNPARAAAILEQWRDLEADKARRCRLVDTYDKLLRINDPLLKGRPLLRYPVLLRSSETRSRLLDKAADEGFYLKDHWYDTLIYPNRFAGLSVYKLGSCPKKEKVNQLVINLPLHRNINRRQAEKLAGLVATFKPLSSTGK